MSEEIFEWSNPEGLFRICMKQDKEIERLNKMLEERFMKENPLLVENGIICMKNKEIERLNKRLKEIDNLVEEVNEAPLVAEDMFIEFYDKYYELKDSDKE